MFALQPSAPRPGPEAVALLVFALAGALLGTVGSAVAGRLSNPVGKYRLLYAAVLLPFALLAYVSLALLGFGSALVATLPLEAPGIFGGVLADLLELLGAGTVWLAAYAPTVRGLGEVRDLDLSTRRALVRMGRYVVGASVVVAGLIAPLRFAPPGASPLVAAVAVLAAASVAALLASPWIVSILRSTHEPTGEVAERVAPLRARAGLDVRDVRVLDTDDEQTASALVRGPPGYRRLFVTTTFLDRFDDGTATALLAIRVVTIVAGGILLVAAVAGAGPRFLLLGGTAAVVLVGFWRSRRAVRAADAGAADRIDRLRDRADEDRGA